MGKGLYPQKISSGYDKWFWNYDNFNFEKSLPTPKILNLQLFLPISIIKISVKAIMNPLFYWISKSFMVFGFSEWHLDFPKILPTQGFWFPKGVPFLGIFLPDHIQMPIDFKRAGDNTDIYSGHWFSHEHHHHITIKLCSWVFFWRGGGGATPPL